MEYYIYATQSIKLTSGSSRCGYKDVVALVIGKAKLINKYSIHLDRYLVNVECMRRAGWVGVVVCLDFVNNNNNRLW